LIAFGKSGALDEVLGRVAAEAQFRKDGHLGSTGFRFARQIKDARPIPFEIADGWIELRQSDLHLEEIAYGARARFSIAWRLAKLRQLVI
jgi:hypothetical protein